MGKKIPVYECKIGNTDDTGIYAVSFVEDPAVERNFIALKKMQPIKLAKDNKKQILTGVVLVPDQLIYRRDTQLGEYYIKFTAQDIEKIAQKMMRTGIALSTTTHQHEKPLKGNYLTEIWLVSDSKKDKAAALGLGELPVGTLVASYKIENPYYWRTEVLTGKVKGFSLEGIFNFNTVTMSKKTKTAAQLAKEQEAAKKGKKSGIPAFLRSVAAMLEGETEAATEDLVEEAAKDEVDAGDPYIIFELADGGEVWVDADGFATLGGEQMAAGEHALADGNFIVIDDEGQLVITQPEADGAEPSEAATELARKRGKQLLAKMGDPKAAKIAKLEKELAELKNEPSAPKAKPKVKTEDKPETFEQKMAAIVRNRRERQDGKKK